MSKEEKEEKGEELNCSSSIVEVQDTYFDDPESLEKDLENVLNTKEFRVMF